MRRRFLYLLTCSLVLPACIIFSLGVGCKVNATLFPKRAPVTEVDNDRIDITQLDKAELIRQVME